MDQFDPHWATRPVSPPYDTIICIYVLNVVRPGEEQPLIRRVRSLLREDTGRAYFAVRRDLPREGRRGRGCIQRYVTLDLPCLVDHSRFAIYECANMGLAQPSWGAVVGK